MGGTLRNPRRFFQRFGVDDQVATNADILRGQIGDGILMDILPADLQRTDGVRRAASSEAAEPCLSFRHVGLRALIAILRIQGHANR